MTQPKAARISRRRFLQGAATTVALPTLIPSGVLAAPGRPGANDRITLGYIGVGGMGTGHVRDDDSNAAAICDVDASHAANAARRIPNSKPMITDDYRRVLDRKEIDAVVIAAPDHWHALMMVHACQAGKDVYCEKPACRTLEEGRAMINAAEYYKRVVQIGSQGRSTPAGHAACQFVRNGQLGTVKRVEVWHEPNWQDGWGQETAPPPDLNWEMWLGPARFEPFNPQRVHFNFRWFLDFGAGFIRDRGAHAFSLVLWLLNQDHAMPVSVEATGTPQKSGIYDVPVTMDVTWEFKNPDWTLTWSQPGQPRDGASWGAQYYGDKDSLIIRGGDGGTDTEPKAMNYTPPANGVHVRKSPGHREDWLNAIRTRGETIMPVKAGVHAASLGILGNLSYRLGRKLQYDPIAERFIGDEESNRYLGAPYRYPWQLS